MGQYRMIMESQKPYIAMLGTQCAYAGMALFSKAAISGGMNPFVFVFYRQAFAFLALSPFAFFSPRKESATLTYSLLGKIFLVALFGVTLSLNLYCVAINYTSATFASASNNTIPAITFIMAVFLRMESVSVRKKHGMAKVVGSIAGVSGALVFAFVRGPPVNLFHLRSLLNITHHHHHQPADSSRSPHTVANNHTHFSSRDSIKGVLLMLSANSFWSLWMILQGPLLKQYTGKLRLTALQCLFSCIQSAFWAAAVERNLAAWKLRWDIHLFSLLYCGVVVTGITYWLQVWVIEKKGPVFTSMFTPLALVITAVFSAFLWKETLYCGSVGGAVMMVGGLYFVLWGKIKEDGESNEAAKAEHITRAETEEVTTKQVSESVV